jgi:hypothetical protein
MLWHSMNCEPIVGVAPSSVEEDAPPVVNLDKLSADELKLSGYCVANPQEDIISAAEALFGK